MARTLKGGSKRSHRKLRRMRTLNARKSTSSSPAHPLPNAVMLIWINKTVSPTIYKGLSYEDMIAEIPIERWVEYKKTQDKNYNIYFVYDSMMVSATPDEIAEYISPISQDVIFLDIRMDLLKWVYDTCIYFFKVRYMDELIPKEPNETEDEYITKFINSYLLKNHETNSFGGGTY